MKNHSRNNRSAFRNLVTRCALTIAALIVSLVLVSPTASAQTGTASPSPSPWPEKPPFKPAINAFTKVLTHAARNKAFRKRLTASCDSAKKAVAELANMKIPDNVVIIFYEGEVIAPTATNAANTSANPQPSDSDDSRQNERVHVFVLPPLNESDQTTEYQYRDYLMCCYEYWRD